MYVVGSFVCVHRIEIAHVAHYVELITHAIAAMHVARLSGDGERLGAAVLVQVVAEPATGGRLQQCPDHTEQVYLVYRQLAAGVCAADRLPLRRLM